MKLTNSPLFLYTVAIVLGLLSGLLSAQTIFSIATWISDAFINLLSLVSLPIIFLSIVQLATNVDNIDSIKQVSKRVIRYTLFTTVAAATVALIVFLLIDPVRDSITFVESNTSVTFSENYMDHILKVIPSNIVKPFAENNVIGVLILALIISGASFTIDTEQRKTLHTFFSSLYAIFMKITSKIILFIPVAIWAFLTLFIRDLEQGFELKTIGYYLLCIIAANLIQGLIVLPLFLKAKKISPRKLFSAMFPALTVAFFTKSSNAALPTATQSAKERANLDPRVVQVSFPLCTTINMNGCAGFILTTTLFVAMMNGIHFSPIELILWVFVATIAAVGNAGVPMGCYFLATSFLATMNIPLYLMGVILPFYSFIDALETAINVWSDSCITAVVDKELYPIANKEPEYITELVKANS